MADEKTQEYELKVPMVYGPDDRREKGSKVELTEARAKELIEQDVIVDPNATTTDDDAEVGAQTVPPSGGDAEDDGAVPTRGAAKGKWVAYATHEDRGEDRLTEDDAKAATRDELADKYLGPKDNGAPTPGAGDQS